MFARSAIELDSVESSTHSDTIFDKNQSVFSHNGKAQEINILVDWVLNDPLINCSQNPQLVRFRIIKQKTLNRLQRKIGKYNRENKDTKFQRQFKGELLDEFMRLKRAYKYELSGLTGDSYAMSNLLKLYKKSRNENKVAEDNVSLPSDDICLNLPYVDEDEGLQENESVDFEIDTEGIWDYINHLRDMVKIDPNLMPSDVAFIFSPRVESWIACIQRRIEAFKAQPKKSFVDNMKLIDSDIKSLHTLLDRCHTTVHFNRQLLIDMCEGLTAPPADQKSSDTFSVMQSCNCIIQ